MLANLEHQKNHYINIHGIKIYTDYMNKRLKVFDSNHITDVALNTIINYARQENLGKIISQCRTKSINSFINCGFKIEGYIMGYFNGEDSYSVSLFVDKNRGISVHQKEEDELLVKIVSNISKTSSKEIGEITVRTACESDIPQMITLFSRVFITYPTPIFNKDYLKDTLNKQILFKVAEYNGQIIGAASADMDWENMNAEITDCATYPEYRGHGILMNLIIALEKDLKQKNYICLYSLSRAINPAINRTLAKLEYKYYGRLINNCHICGNFEDMNIWAKKL